MTKRKFIQRPGGQAFAIRVKPKPPPKVLKARAAEKLRKAEERKQKAEERKQKAEERKNQREKKGSLKGRANVARKRTRSLVWRRQQAWKKTESGETGEQLRVVKPPYSVPSLVEINAALRDGGNGYRVVSTFSGAGGACLGLKMAGYQVLWANDFIPAAQDTYQINHPAAILDYRDVRDIHPEDILQAIGLEPGELEVMEGSPPCSGFSMAGQREDGWGKIKDYSDGRQQVDDLFFEYARLVDGLCPMVFLAENTSGLTIGSSRGMFKMFMHVLAQCGAGTAPFRPDFGGYLVEAAMLDASRLGVPQSRKRVVFIGVRRDLVEAYGVKPVFPSVQPFVYTFREAIADLTDPGEYQTIREGTAIYEGWLRARPGESFDKARQFIDNRKTMFNTTKLAWDTPAPTVLRGPQLYHPIQARTLGLNELRRIAGFPDDFTLTGPFAHKWERIGRAVPPLMYSEVGDVIAEKILDVITGSGSDEPDTDQDEVSLCQENGKE